MKPRVTSFAPQFLVDDLERSIAYYQKIGFTFGEPWEGVTPQKRVANLWTEFSAQPGEALIANGKELQNPNKLVVAATFEMAKT